VDYLSEIIDRIRKLKKFSKTLLIAIDGRGGSGKSTLAKDLSQRLEEVAIVHLDDFAYPMGGADRQRLLDQVILPLKEEKLVKYKKRNFETKELTTWHEISPGGIVIIEGVITLHNLLEKYYDFKIWIECPAEVGFQRGVQRDKNEYGIDTEKDWKEKWLPEEDIAIVEQKPQEKADYILDNTVLMEAIKSKQIYLLLAQTCSVLNKNKIQYLVYGSVAMNLLTNQEQEVNDIDIMVNEIDFEKIKNILPDSLKPIQTKFSIHANSKKYLGKNNKPFDVSFDSYEYYFQKTGLDMLKPVRKEMEGVLINLMPFNSLKKLYEIFEIPKPKSNSDEFYNPRLVAIYNTVCPIDEYKDFYIDLAKKLSARTIIDIGCGTGLLTCELAKQGYQVIGVEPSKLMLEVARKSEYGERVEWIEGDALSLGGSNADLAIMTGHVAQFHLEDEYWLKVLRSIHKSLRQGGHLVFESRNPAVQPWVDKTKKVDWFSPDFSKKVYDPKAGEIEIRVGNTKVKGERVVNELHYIFTKTGEDIISKTELIFRTKEELKKSLEEAGFIVENIYGNWDWSLANPKSPELIFVTSKG